MYSVLYNATALL